MDLEILLLDKHRRDGEEFDHWDDGGTFLSI
jgi:hypothetical protein